MSMRFIIDEEDVRHWIAENADRIDGLEDVDAIYQFDPSHYTTYTALEMAIITDRRDVLEALLRRGAKTEKLDLLLCHNGWKADNAIAFCREKGYKPGFVALKKAVQERDLALLRALFDQGADANITDTWRSALFDTVVIASGNLEMIALFLERGAKMTRSSLHYALDPENWRKVIALMIDAGAEVDARHGKGVTLFLDVCRSPYVNSYSEILEKAALLLDYGADINAATEEGYTSLIYASAAGWLERVELLLQRGADWRLRDNQGRTALDFARLKGHAAVVDRLETVAALS